MLKMLSIFILITGLMLFISCSNDSNGSQENDAGIYSGTVDGGDNDDPYNSDKDPVDPNDFEWPVATEPVTITPSEFWKNEIEFPHNKFLNRPETEESIYGWVKFVVIMKDPSKVYFQDSRKYAFHYEFTTNHLDQWQGISKKDFYKISLHEKDQELILGTVIFSQRRAIREYGIQLVRKDSYHPGMVKVVLDLVHKSVKFDGDLQPFYFPTFEQQKSAENYTDFFETSGFPVNSVDRWSTGNTCYSTGWTLGNLVFIEANKIDGAYSDGTLKPADILLTDGIPAEVPFVAGLVSMAPSTANSHVAILAKTFNIPFVYLSKESDREHARTLIGKEVALRAVNDYERCTVRLEEIIGLEKKERSELLALKKTSTLNFPQKEKAGKYFSSADILTPSETKFYGGKSSNFGILRTSIPDNSPTPAIAFSFDLFDDFMTLKISSRKTVRQEIDALLNSYSYPPDVASLYSNLSKIRDMIENDVEFSSEMKEKVKTALASFDQNKKIRFRSSTNVEDTTTFSGAGLYDSYSGCLADDKESDD